VLDVFRERLEYPDLRRKVIDGHRRWSSLARNFALLIEEGSGMSFIQDLRQAGIRAIRVNPEKEKILRMNAHTAKIEAGYVHLPRHASWLGEFRRELMAFPACKHDDQVDALSQALDRAFKPKQKVYWTTRRGSSSRLAATELGSLLEAGSAQPHLSFGLGLDPSQNLIGLHWRRDRACLSAIDCTRASWFSSQSQAFVPKTAKAHNFKFGARGTVHPRAVSPSNRTLASGHRRAYTFLG
jgi:predicted phage terminase large subunit-like protein